MSGLWIFACIVFAFFLSLDLDFVSLLRFIFVVFGNWLVNVASLSITFSIASIKKSLVV